LWVLGNILLGLAKYSSGVGKIQQWGWENTVVGLGKYRSGDGKIL